MSLRSHARFLPLLIALGATALGCGSSTSAEPVASAESAATRAPIAPGAHGKVRLFGAALGDVPLTATQRTQIEQLAADAQARQADAAAARQDLMLALATQVEGGAIDRAALQPKIDALSVAVQKTQPADRAAFERLHAILGPDQRTAFVDALEARLHERMGAMGDRHPMKQWAEDLKLSDDQRAQIKTIMRQRFEAGHHEHGAAPWMEGRQRGAKLLSAFKQDRFVMDEVAPQMDAHKQAGAMADHFIGLAEQVLPILTADQRVLAAQKLRTRANDLEHDAIP